MKVMVNGINIGTIIGGNHSMTITHALLLLGYAFTGEYGEKAVNKERAVQVINLETAEIWFE